MEDGQISRQLFASPEVDATLDDDHSGFPFHYFLASAFWYAWIRRRISPPTWPSGTMKSFMGAGGAAAGKGGHAYSFPGTPLSGLSNE